MFDKIIILLLCRLINLPELKVTMNDMAKEMERAGLIDTLIGDTFDMMDVSL